MAQAAKVQEPTMEEILASIRRIIADDDGSKAKPAEPPKAQVSVAPPAPKAAPPPPPPPPTDAAAMSQADIDAMLAGAGGGQLQEEDQETADVFELTEAMTGPAPTEPPPFRKIDPSPDVFFSEDEPPPRPLAPRAAPAVEAPVLLSASTTAAVDAAFNSLAHTVLVQNAKTLEDLVREMLRPMLKSWLDDNLPTLVERLVRAEIERVSRGRG